MLGNAVQGIGYGPIAFHMSLATAGVTPSFRSIALSLLIGMWVAIVGSTADILDIEDDRANNIRTMAVQLGQQTATLCVIVIGVIEIALAGMTQMPWNWKLPKIFLMTVLVGVFIEWARNLWSHRKTRIPSSLHGLTLLLEILYPFAVVF
jgi:1,4-dihydroxy-2-naphthoate octaprenyltransferase